MEATNFMTLMEVANTLNVTRQTVSKYIQNKELNAVKMNKSYRVNIDDFNSFIKNKSMILTSTVYAKKSRNCILDYNNKTSEEDIFSAGTRGIFKTILKEHDVPHDKFIFGDNYNVLHELIRDYKGKIDLIYIDPPFGTGQNFADIESAHAYSDNLVDSEFLEFLRKRLFLLRELLSPVGRFIYTLIKRLGIM